MDFMRVRVYFRCRCNNSQQWNGNNWRSSVHAHQRACHKLGFIDTAHGSPYVNTLLVCVNLVEYSR